MDTSNYTTPLKKCSKCNTEYPPTPEYFCRSAQSNDGLKRECKACSRQRNKAYRLANPEQHRERSKRYHQENAEKDRVYRKRYYLENAVAARSRSRRWRENNLERARAKSREWNASNRERAEGNRRRWRLATVDLRRIAQVKTRSKNRDKYSAHERNRQARIRNAEGSHSELDIQKQLKRQKSKCYYCGCVLDKKRHVDHVVPLSRGGSNDPSNLVIACHSCNESKGAKLPHEWEGNHGRMF